MSIQPVYPNYAKRPTTAKLKTPAIALHSIVRDQFSIATWLLLGALIQGLASVLLPYRNIVLVLPILLLGYKLTKTLLTLSGVIANPRMKGVHLHRTAAVLPDANGLPAEPGNSTVCAILLGAISNHPLGMLAPGLKEMGVMFDAMIEELSADATKHGFLGATSWLGAGQRTTSNENLIICYFESEEYLHEYAHGPMHTKAMMWWRETEKAHGHMGIMHEIFACPKKSWEGIYVNYGQSGLGTTTKEVTSQTGEKSWASPIMRIKGKKLMYSKGRMGRSFGKNEWDALEAFDPDADYA